MLNALYDVYLERKLTTIKAYAEYWRAASKLSEYKQYSDACFYFASKNYKWVDEKGWCTPEGDHLDVGVGCAFMIEAHKLPEWNAYCKKATQRNRAAQAHIRFKYKTFKTPEETASV